MKITCPICHGSYSLEAVATNAAAREMNGLLVKCGLLGAPLVAYLGLFRPKTKTLPWDKTLRLAKDVLALSDDKGRLTVALVDTVDAMRRKQDAGEFRPFKNHRYLAEVLEGTPAAGGTQAVMAPGKSSRGGKPAPLHIAAERLEAWAGDHWLRNQIRHGLLILLAQPLGKAPAVETIEVTAAAWEYALHRAGCKIEEVDLDRVGKAMADLVARPGEWFPTTEKLVGLLPRRLERTRIAEHVEDDLVKGREFFQKMSQ